MIIELDMTEAKFLTTSIFNSNSQQGISIVIKDVGGTQKKIINRDKRQCKTAKHKIKEFRKLNKDSYKNE